jgi:hypothetical protein
MSGAVQTGTPFPPLGPTTTQRQIPSYLYQQYQDDDALQAFVAAQNVLQQDWLNWFNQINLPVWFSLSGALLDWVGQGLYGYPRPTLSYTQAVDLGGYGTAFYGQLAYGMSIPLSTTTLLPVNDDIYKRMLTWHLFKGDGFQFTMRWLKQRIHRFLNGANGFLAVNDTTEDVSVTCSGTTFTVTLASSSIAQIFQFAISDGVLAFPFMFDLTVVLV